MLINGAVRSTIQRGFSPSFVRFFSVNPNEQVKEEFLHFHKRQVKQPVSFGETISFNLHDYWTKLPNVTVNKHAKLGEVFGAYYTNYEYKKIYLVLLFALISLWGFHVKLLSPEERVLEKRHRIRLENLAKGEQIPE